MPRGERKRQKRATDVADKYTTTPANAGEKTVLLVGWTVEAVFVGPDHAGLAERVAELLNREAAEISEEEASVPS